MPILYFETIIPAPLETVWAFHDDPARNLPLLAPATSPVAVTHVERPIAAGSRIILSVKGPFGRTMRWEARITEHSPPHPVVFGFEARFVDEMESGPFASWRHEHDFEAVDSKSTRLVDRITYRLPWGPLGVLIDWIWVRPRLRAIFAHRSRVLQRLA